LKIGDFGCKTQKGVTFSHHYGNKTRNFTLFSMLWKIATVIFLVGQWVQHWQGWLDTRDGLWPNPTRPAANKGPTRLQPGYFLTRPEEIFFDPKRKKLKNLTFLGEIFQIQTQTINDWPDPSHKKLTQPDPDPSLLDTPKHIVEQFKVKNSKINSLFTNIRLDAVAKSWFFCKHYLSLCTYEMVVSILCRYYTKFLLQKKELPHGHLISCAFHINHFLKIDVTF